MTTNNNPWFTKTAALTPEKSERIRAMLADTAAKHGFSIYGTGGYVRDRLLGYTPDDFDVAVYKSGMDPEKAKLEFAKLFVADHGLPAPVSYGQTNTQFIDVDGSKVEVNNHGRTLEEEAKNRDYTVNALFEDLSKPGSPVIDSTGYGLQDIKDRVLRSADPKDPARLFKDSPERILRGLRFMASRGMEFEPETLEALKGSVELLADTAKENIGREFLKMMGHKATPKAWRLATELDIAKYVIPEWEAMRGVEQRPDYHHLPVDQHTLSVLENVPEDLILQLAAILHDTGKPAYKKVEDSLIKFHEHEVGSKQIADRVLKELGFPEDIRGTVVKLVGEHMRAHAYRSEWSDKTVRRLVRDLGGDVDKALALAKADLLGGNPEKHAERLRMLEELGARIKKEQEAATAPLHEMKPILNGDELQQMFQRPPGKWIGDAQKYLTELQLEDPSLDKTRAAEAIRSWLAEGAPAPVAEPSPAAYQDSPPPGEPGIDPSSLEEKKGQMAPQKTASQTGHGIISAEIAGLTPEQNVERMKKLRARVDGMGYKWEEMDGSWKGVPEKSLLVKNIPEEVMKALTDEFCQEAYVTVRASAGGIRLWLDDKRPIPAGFNAEAKTAEEAIAKLKAGGVEHISLDHDLGPEEGNSGYEVAKFIEAAAYHGSLKPLTWAVHSGNPSGAGNIRLAMEQAEKFWSDTSRTARLVVGSSGFGHETWEGRFYPKAMLQKDRLGFYAKHFAAVEITATRHSIPPTRVLENWAKAAPKGFVFAFCAPTSIRPSNMKDGGAEEMRRFMRRIAVFGDKLGPVVLTIGEQARYAAGDAKRFFDALPPHRYAVHVESVEWQNQEVLEEMLARKYAAVDTVGGIPATDSCGWSYRRLSPDKLYSIGRRKSGVDYVFVVDKTAAFPSKEMMQALRDLGLTMGPDGITMLPHHGPTDPSTGPANSAMPSGSYDDERGEPLTVVKPTEKEDDTGFFGDNRFSPVQYPDTDAADGKSDPLTGTVDGDTREML